MLDRRTLLTIGAGLLAGARQSRAAPLQPRLRRGVAASSWFSNAPRQPLFEPDFIKIANAGFDHVRLTINPDDIGFQSATAPGQPAPDPGHARWDLVDHAVSMITRNGLTVLLNIHPEEAFRDRLTTQAWLRDDMVAFAGFIAGRYKTLDRDKFAFELLNEPRFYRTPGLYRSFMQRMIKEVRSEMVDHILLLGGPFTNDIPSLCQMTPFDDPSIVYVFHYYDPFIVTHQGIGTKSDADELRAFSNVPYPSSKVQPGTDYAHNPKSRLEAARELRQYVIDDWDGSRIRATIQPVAEWAASRQRRVVCTEFGANRVHTDSVSRYAWIADTRQVLERAGFGWTIWDYADIFGITTPDGHTVVNPSDGAVTLIDPERGSRTIEPEALEALGLGKG